MSYGFSIKVNDDGDFDFDPDKLSIQFVEDEDNFVQVIKSTLRTIKGEDKFFTNFGVNYKNIMQKNIVYDNLKHEINNALIRDPRVKKVQNIKLNRPERGVLNIEIEVVSNENTVFNISDGITW